jgi:hypothetical protein
MSETDDRIQNGILGDINPRPRSVERDRPRGSEDETFENEESMVGGTRNYRTGTGVTGADIGNRPEQ